MITTQDEPAVTQQTAHGLGLLTEEFEQIKKVLGRTPNYTELSLYSVMWSEHCSYKNSIKWLKKLPREGKHLLAKAGEENAGLVDIGEGLGCAFKIESHNHPSAIEPYQGAATGVGGIHRDIFTMGARPVAALNSLRFGELTEDKTKHLVRGVVKGIGDYGNAFGIPTVAGEVYFDECYNTNPLVNAMSVGIIEIKKTVSATSHGEGNPVFIVGSATGKDGIHGATFASADISEDSSEKLPSVQVGDPFQEKLLLEASLEVVDTGALIGMQDMGAAGIICSTSEMSAKGQSGMVIHLDKVPTRQKNMRPFEILLSESQERMLIVVKKGNEKKVLEIFDKWDLNCVQIGEVTHGDRLKFFMYDELVADVPAESLVLGGGAPQYDREVRKPAYLEKINSYSISQIPVPENLVEVAEKIISLPTIASKQWITEQYDSTVGIANASTNKPSDAAIVRIKNSRKALAVKVDCNSRYVFADPRKGTAIAVAEAARNITCSGGEPCGVTNCLNFGNPYNPEVYWQFTEAIKGMSDACTKFETPVTGGNVSFYNQSSDDGPVFPTPVIGMLGLLSDMDNQMTLDFKSEGDLIFLLGKSAEDISSSQYLAKIAGIEFSPAPYFNLEEEYAMHQAVKKLIRNKSIESAHDCSEGGLFVTLMESSMPRGLGFKIKSDPAIRKDACLFGEAQGRVVVSIQKIKENEFLKMIDESKVPYSFLGKVSGESIQIDEDNFGVISEWKNKYDSAIGNLLNEN